MPKRKRNWKKVLSEQEIPEFKHRPTDVADVYDILSHTSGSIQQRRTLIRKITDWLQGKTLSDPVLIQAITEWENDHTTE